MRSAIRPRMPVSGKVSTTSSPGTNPRAARTTSSRVTRPPEPVPETAPTSTPHSMATRAASGVGERRRAPPAMAASTSRPTTAPLGPLPVSSAQSRPYSRARVRAQGEAKRRSPTGPTCPTCLTCPTGSPGGASPSAQSHAIRLSAGTSSPSETDTPRRIPLAGASTSSTALSVSTANSGSPAATASPSRLCHVTMVTASTLVPSGGTRTSVAISPTSGP